MNRRGFMGAILAAGAAPAVVKCANLMPMLKRSGNGLLVPGAIQVYEDSPLWGTSIAELIAGNQRKFNHALGDLIFDIRVKETPLIRFAAAWEASPKLVFDESLPSRISTFSSR